MEQLVFAKEAAGVANERHQEIEGLGRQSHGLAVVKESSLSHVEREFSELVDLSAGHPFIVSQARRGGAAGVVMACAFHKFKKFFRTGPGLRGYALPMSNAIDLFSGTWKLNPSKSQFDPRHRPSDGVLSFERVADGYIMRAEGICDGKRVTEPTQQFVLDGEERPIPGAPGIVGASTQPDANTIRTEGRRGEMIIGEASYVVSADRSTLTATVRGVDAQQQRFETMVVWDRQ